MPFGKYKGQRLEDVPDDYLAWCFTIARPPLNFHIAFELYWREQLELLRIPCFYCGDAAAGWCERCPRRVCFRHIRLVGPATAYCFDHWDHWQDNDRFVRMPPEESVRWADEHPDEANKPKRRRKAAAAQTI